MLFGYFHRGLGTRFNRRRLHAALLKRFRVIRLSGWPLIPGANTLAGLEYEQGVCHGLMVFITILNCGENLVFLKIRCNM
jgi:hypothetical protein